MIEKGIEIEVAEQIIINEATKGLKDQLCDKTVAFEKANAHKIRELFNETRVLKDILFNKSFAFEKFNAQLTII